MGIALQGLGGLFLMGAGAAGLLRLVPAVASFAYPVLWWGLLLALDAVNYRRFGVSPIRRDARHFLGVTVPLSVLFWLLYEFLNLFFPQWRYRGDLHGMATWVIFGFASFATVIPIIVEFQWLIAGPTFGWCVPGRVRKAFWNYRWLPMGAGLLLTALPAWTKSFWLNQGMWIGPALLLAPFVLAPLGSRDRCPPPGRMIASLVAAALAGGFCWELFNYWSITKWEYTIQIGMPRIFEMPALGYFGFVPFAFSTVAAYLWQLRLRPRPATVAFLYGAAVMAMYAMVNQNLARSLWVQSP